MTSAHRFDPSILREYDIRGIVGKTVTAADAAAVGRALGTMIRRKGGRTACLGYDGRDSSPEFAEAAAGGLRAVGIDVTDVGLGPTPMLYYAVFSLDADGGLMITASHNPAEYNGFKLMLGKESLYGSGIQELGRLSAAADLETGAGGIERRELLDDYVVRLAGDFRAGRPLKAAWDAGNGAAGEAMRLLTERLPGKHILLNAEIDGSFPAHHPDPTVPENLVQLQETVRAQGCDLGLALDGDGDRLGVVDGQGRILWADQVMVMLAGEVLGEHPGATIIADVKASQVLYDEIARLGGTPLMWKTGHSLIKAKMKAEAAPLAGEMSGHIFYADRYYGYDDALYAAVRLLGILGSSERSLAELRDTLPPVINTPELRFECPDDRKGPVIEEVRSRLAASGAEVDATDGVRVRTDDGWWLLRASNTQDALVARCEARDEAGLERLKDQLNSQLESSGLARLPG